MRIKIFIEIAISGEEGLDPGPEPLAGLCHGVPVQGALQRLHVLDPVLDFVVRLCINL